MVNRKKYVESCYKSFEDSIRFGDRPYGITFRGRGIETVYAVDFTLSRFVIKYKDSILKLLNELESEKNET